VAAGLGPGFEDCHIVYCAYSRYRLPPSKINRLPPNMVVLITQPRTRFYDKRKRQQAYDLIAAWQKLKPQAVYFCRYANSMIKMTPSLAPHMIARDIRELKRISDAGDVKLKGEMNFCGMKADSPYAWWFQLNQYVTAKLLWNPDLDVDALLDDYCAKYYGPAAEPMRRLLRRCEALYFDDAQRDIYRLETIDELEGLLEAARRKAAGTPDGERLAAVDRGFGLLRQMRRKLQSAKACPPPVNPDEGLTARFAFDEGKGEVTRDAVSGRTGTIRHAKWTDGKFGRALEFSGTESAVRIEPLTLADTDYTIMAWIRPAEIRFGGEQFIVGPTMWNRICLKIVRARLTLLHRSPKDHRLSAPAREFTDHTWWHVAGTFSRRDGMALYLNGRLVALDSTATEPAKSPVAFLAASGDGSTRDSGDVTGCFKGAIDEIRIYSRELSPGEVLVHAQQNPGTDEGK